MVSRIKEAASCTALVVDNDELVRLGTVVMLREIGFTMMTAPDGPSGLVLIDAAKMPDILVTDYEMPGMNGIELATTITSKSPGVHVLIVTGHNDLGQDIPGHWQVLQKPFTSLEMQSALEIFGIRTGQPKG
jgi:CheY-like chemotaxis protein